MGKIKILLFYVVYPMAIATYFKEALQHRDDVELLVVGPYTANWIPWLNGMTVPEKYSIPPDIALPFPPNIGEVNYDLVRAMLPKDWIPDLIINVDAGLHWKSKPFEGMVVTIATDPHVLNYDIPRKYSDKFFNMQLCYSEKGDVYLPYAYSQYDHYPEVGIVKDVLGFYKQEDEIKIKDTDACLIGLPYTHVPRTQWVEELRKKGVSVIFENGPIFDEARQMYNRCKIGLNWSTMNDLNARAFELPAMKLAPVMNLVPDMHRFSFYKDTLLFTELQGAIEQVLWLKEHSVDCDRIAQDAYNDVQGETYDNRVSLLLEECGFI